jgi:hypothetical protein
MAKSAAHIINTGSAPGVLANEFGLRFSAPDHVHSYGFADVRTSPLVLDAVYAGGRAGNVKDDPLARMFPGAGNQGGFRPIGGRAFGKCRALLIYTSGKETDWPDQMNLERGTFNYYGDNRHPGRDLHDTTRGGNLLLREMFDALGGPLARRRLIPPIFVFARTQPGWSVKFRGLAVPGEAGVSHHESLVAIWRMSGDNRFQNYRATFTILDTKPLIKRSWIDAICGGKLAAAIDGAPKQWLDWLERGVIRPLQVKPLLEPRTRQQQMPDEADIRAWEMLDALHLTIGDRAFEFVAVAIFKLAEPNIFAEVTRSTVDGGRDAVGQLALGGIIGGAHHVEFALEAKHFMPRSSNGVTVGHTKRLISRLRHRQFGVLVTTSHVSRQAYSEIIEDQHPIVVIAGRDIVRLFRSKGINDAKAVQGWVEQVMGTVPE